MVRPHDSANPRVLRRWLFATWRGWLIGFLLVLLGAVAADVVGVEGIQSFVGGGMGVGVGYGQRRWAGSCVGADRRWVLASGLGVGAPFVLSDLLRAVRSQSLYSLPLAAVCGGLLAGVLEERLLRPRFARTTWWIPASLTGWTLAALTVALVALLPRNPWLAFAALGAVLLGSGVLGLVTGAALEWLLRSRPPAAA